MTDDKPDINALLEHYGTRVKHRTSYMTNCVLHEDNTPSLSVHTERGLFNCKSCGEKGDAYTLIQLKEGLDFVGARAFAATLGLAAGSAGGGDGGVSGSRYTTGRKVPSRKGDRPSNGGYVPTWRRS